MKHRWLVFALLCQGLLSTGYLFVTPAFESPDEPGHFLYARHLLLQRALPLIPGSAAELGRERAEESSMAHHPPLYYGLLAATQEVLGAPDVMPTLRKAFRPGEPRTILLWKHAYDEVAPVSREVDVFRLLRGWSVVFGLLSVLLTHRLGRLLFPDAPGVADAGALLLACLPQWSFTHGVLDNGNLATTLGCAVFVLLAQSWRSGFSLPRGLLLGLCIGLALQTKLTTLFLVPLTGGVHLLAVWRRAGERRRVLTSLAASAALTAAVGASFFLRNWELYADPLALRAHELAYAASRQAPHRVRWFFLHRFPTETFRTFIGAFGWGGSTPPEVWYVAAKGLGLLALAGWVARLRRPRPELFRLLLLGAIVGLVFAGLVRFNLSYRQAQGRYLFAAAGALLLLVAAGLETCWRLAGARPWLARAAGVALVASAATLLVTRVRTDLAFPVDPDPYQAILVADLSRPARHPSDAIELLAPDDGALLSAPATFRWRLTDDAPRDGRYSLHLFGRPLHAGGPARSFGASWENGSLALEDGRFTLDPGVWERMPRGAELFWKIRRVPDRQAGENVADVEESRTWAFRIAP